MLLTLNTNLHYYYYYGDWWLAGSCVRNTVKYHSWPDAYRGLCRRVDTRVVFPARLSVWVGLVMWSQAGSNGLTATLCEPVRDTESPFTTTSSISFRQKAQRSPKLCIQTSSLCLLIKVVFRKPRGNGITFKKQKNKKNGNQFQSRRQGYVYKLLHSIKTKQKTCANRGVGCDALDWLQ